MQTSHIVIVVIALAAAYYFLVHKKKYGIHPVMASKAAAGPSKKSRWRRALGSATKMASVAGVPGAGQFGAIAGAGGLL
jgi:hypothetical protein